MLKNMNAPKGSQNRLNDAMPTISTTTLHAWVNYIRKRARNFYVSINARYARYAANYKQNVKNPMNFIYEENPTKVL